MELPDITTVNDTAHLQLDEAMVCRPLLRWQRDNMCNGCFSIDNDDWLPRPHIAQVPTELILEGRYSSLLHMSIIAII